MDREKCPESSVLSTLPFDLMGSGNLATLGDYKSCSTYQKGQLIFIQGQMPQGVYCIKSGKIKVFKTGDDGRQQIVRLAKAGELIGYRSFLGEEAYSASAAALEESQICLIGREDFHSMLQNNAKFSWWLLQKLSSELREAEDFLRDMAQKSVRERLALILLMLHRKFGTENSDLSGALAVHLTRDELASFVGTATETLIRLLTDFRTEGLVEAKGKDLCLINLPELSRLAGVRG